MSSALGSVFLDNPLLFLFILGSSDLMVEMVCIARDVLFFTFCAALMLGSVKRIIVVHSLAVSL